MHSSSNGNSSSSSSCSKSIPKTKWPAILSIISPPSRTGYMYVCIRVGEVRCTKERRTIAGEIPRRNQLKGNIDFFSTHFRPKNHCHIYRVEQKCLRGFNKFTIISYRNELPFTVVIYYKKKH